MVKYFALAFAAFKVVVTAFVVVHFYGWTAFLILAGLTLLWQTKFVVEEKSTRHGITYTKRYGS